MWASAPQALAHQILFALTSSMNVSPSILECCLFVQGYALFLISSTTFDYFFFWVAPLCFVVEISVKRLPYTHALEAVVLILLSRLDLLAKTASAG
jgi:hypothetical protein